MEPSSTLHDDENDRQPPIGRLLLPSNQQLRRAKWFKTSRPTLPNHWEKKQQPPVLPPLSPSSTAVVATSYAAAGIDRWRQPQQHSSSLVKKSEVKAEKEGIRMLLLVADDSRPPPQGLRRISMARGELTATSAKQYKTKKPLKLPLLELAVTWQGGAMIVNNLSIGSPGIFVIYSDEYSTQKKLKKVS
jgi:hypothetical protein